MKVRLLPLRWITYVISAVLLSVVLSLFASAAWARSAAELRAFQRATPCPSNDQRRGPCPGYQIDHIEPLCAGGVDQAHNMQWLTIEEHRWKTRTDVRVCRQLGRQS